MQYYVGLDVSLRSAALCVINTEGTIIIEQSLYCEVEANHDYLCAFDRPIKKIGSEAGTMSQVLFHGLKALDFNVVCMEARHVSAALAAMRNKTDKNDARGIAHAVIDDTGRRACNGF